MISGLVDGPTDGRTSSWAPSTRGSETVKALHDGNIVDWPTPQAFEAFEEALDADLWFGVRPMTRVYIEIILCGLPDGDGRPESYPGRRTRDGSVLQRSEIVLKPDEIRSATISFGEPCRWDNNDGSEAFRALQRRWFLGDQSPFSGEFVRLVAVDAVRETIQQTLGGILPGVEFIRRP